jgi:chromosome segregation ATPase
MGWITETLKALFALDDEQRLYRDSLANAERYVQWGTEQSREADLRTALKLLVDCPAEKAPNAHYAYRRWRTQAQAHSRLAAAAVAGLRDKSEKLRDSFNALEEGRRALLHQIEQLRTKVDNLEVEGSLISAREERRRLEEMEREAGELPDMAEEKTARRTAVLDALQPSFKSHREGAATGLAELRKVEGLADEDREVRDVIAEDIERALQQAAQDWKTTLAAFEEMLRSAGTGSEAPA